MDLIDGVGEIPIQLPTTMGNKNISQLPAWLYEVACKEDGSKIVADRFLSIEKAEQHRMQEALNVSVVYDSPMSTSVKPHTLAGVEKGSKNRYNNIWPYDHSRVKLQEYPVEECDYVNASHVSVPHSRKRYIASQAPLPSTFRVSLPFRDRQNHHSNLLGFLVYGLGARRARDRHVDGRRRGRTTQEPQVLGDKWVWSAEIGSHTREKGVPGAHFSQDNAQETFGPNVEPAVFFGLKHTLHHSPEIYSRTHRRAILAYT